MSPRGRTQKHKWAWKTRFRVHAFGWRSQPAISRVREAVAEIRSVAKKDRVVAAEGAIEFLERVSAAIEQVDGSSGAMGSAVYWAVAELAAVIAEADVDAPTRRAWLERLWEAYENDEIPYIESLGDQWGEVCASQEIASEWADRLMGTVKMAWSPDPTLRGFFKGTTNCLSALVAAERHDEVLALLTLAPYKMWDYRQYGVKALAAQGRLDDAIRYAEEDRGLNDSQAAIAQLCEGLLLAAGRHDDAYRRYAVIANRAGTYLATFRAVAKKYPSKGATEILGDLVKSTPGDEGKWFAAAKAHAVAAALIIGARVGHGDQAQLHRHIAPGTVANSHQRRVVSILSEGPSRPPEWGTPLLECGTIRLQSFGTRGNTAFPEYFGGADRDRTDGL